jgi:hypothetical protein
MFTDSNIDFLQNAQSCDRNSLRHKTEADELQECTSPWSCADKGAGADGDDADDSESDEEVDFKVVCHEDILALMEQPVDIDTHDDDPEFLKEHPNSFSFDNVRYKGRKGCGHMKDVEAQVRQRGSLLNGVPFVVKMAAVGSCALRVKQNPPEKKLQCSVNAIAQVMFSKTTAKLRRGFVDGTGVNLSDANGAIKSIREWSMAVFFERRHPATCKVTW